MIPALPPPPHPLPPSPTTVADQITEDDLIQIQFERESESMVDDLLNDDDDDNEEDVPLPPQQSQLHRQHHHQPQSISIPTTPATPIPNTHTLRRTKPHHPTIDTRSPSEIAEDTDFIVQQDPLPSPPPVINPQTHQTPPKQLNKISKIELRRHPLSNASPDRGRYRDSDIESSPGSKSDVDYVNDLISITNVMDDLLLLPESSHNHESKDKNYGDYTKPLDEEVRPETPPNSKFCCHDIMDHRSSSSQSPSSPPHLHHHHHHHPNHQHHPLDQRLIFPDSHILHSPRASSYSYGVMDSFAKAYGGISSLGGSVYDSDEPDDDDDKVNSDDSEKGSGYSGGSGSDGGGESGGIHVYDDEDEGEHEDDDHNVDIDIDEVGVANEDGFITAILNAVLYYVNPFNYFKY